MEKGAVMTFVLFGGTGDLTKRKLVPAFAELVQRRVISEKSKIVGISRKQMNDEEYKKILIDSAGSEESKEGIKKLKDQLNYCEIEGCNRIYYLATSFAHFPTIVKNLKEHGLNKAEKGF